MREKGWVRKDGSSGEQSWVRLFFVRGKVVRIVRASVCGGDASNGARARPRGGGRKDSCCASSSSSPPRLRPLRLPHPRLAPARETATGEPRPPSPSVRAFVTAAALRPRARGARPCLCVRPPLAKPRARALRLSRPRDTECLHAFAMRRVVADMGRQGKTGKKPRPTTPPTGRPLIAPPRRSRWVFFRRLPLSTSQLQTQTTTKTTTPTNAIPKSRAAERPVGGFREGAKREHQQQPPPIINQSIFFVGGFALPPPLSPTPTPCGRPHSPAPEKTLHHPQTKSCSTRSCARRRPSLPWTSRIW